MSEKKKPAGPKHKFYVSLVNGGVYAAMTHPAGYEDDNPSEWRPASQADLSDVSATQTAPTPPPVRGVQEAPKVRR